MENLTSGTRIESLENLAKQLNESLTDCEESVLADNALLKSKFSTINISSQRSVDGKETSELSKGR